MVDAADENVAMKLECSMMEIYMERVGGHLLHSVLLSKRAEYS